MIRGWARTASTVALLLVVTLLTVCLIESADVSAAEHHGCAALLSGAPNHVGVSSLVAKIPAGIGLAILAQVSPPSPAGSPTVLAFCDDTRSILAAPLGSQLSPRSPPVLL